MPSIKTLSRLASQSEPIDQAICGNPKCRWQTVKTRGVLCESCISWYHFSCANTTEAEIKHMSSDTPFHCPQCSQCSQRVMLDNTKPGMLPTWNEFHEPNFTWGSLTSTEFTELIDRAYEKIVRSRKNLFKLPSGKAGRDFIVEWSRVLNGYVNKTPLERIAIKCFMTMPGLLLQKPSRKSKSKDHSTALERRLCLWKDGKIEELMREFGEIQSNLDNNGNKRRTVEQTAKRFAKLVFEGKIKSALRFLSENSDPLEAIGRSDRDFKNETSTAKTSVDRVSFKWTNKSNNRTIIQFYRR